MIEKYKWRIDVFYKHHTHRIIENEGTSYENACSILGGLCLGSTVEKIIVYRDDKLDREIEVKEQV